MDAEFFVNADFQFRGCVRKTSTVLEVPASVVRQELKKGPHSETRKPLSGLLNHCSPANDYARKLLGMPSEEEEEEALAAKEVVDEKPGEEETKPEGQNQTERIKIYAEFDRIGKAFDGRWAMTRLRQELIKARKETGT